jgi:putative SOS response-associated peptidase YedK
MTNIHDRMPVIVAPADFDRWLGSTGDTHQGLADLLGPSPDELLEAIPVGDGINRIDSDGPALQAPIGPKHDPAPGFPGL